MCPCLSQHPLNIIISLFDHKKVARIWTFVCWFHSPLSIDWAKKNHLFNPHIQIIHILWSWVTCSTLLSISSSSSASRSARPPPAPPCGPPCCSSWSAMMKTPGLGKGFQDFREGHLSGRLQACFGSVKLKNQPIQLFSPTGNGRKIGLQEKILWKKTTINFHNLGISAHWCWASLPWEHCPALSAPIVPLISHTASKGVPVIIERFF